MDRPCALCWGWSAVSKRHKFLNSGKPRSENVTLNWKSLCISMCVRDKQMNTVSLIIWLAPSTGECDVSETQHHTEKTLYSEKLEIFVFKLMSGSQQSPGCSYCITFLQMLLLLYWYCDYTHEHVLVDWYTGTFSKHGHNRKLSRSWIVLVFQHFSKIISIHLLTGSTHEASWASRILEQLVANQAPTKCSACITVWAGIHTSHSFVWKAVCAI